MSADNPISPKVVASTGGAGFGAALATLLTWVLGVTVWDASTAADKAAAAITAVPTPVSGVIVLAVPSLLAALSSWLITDPRRVTTTQLRMLEAMHLRDSE